MGKLAAIVRRELIAYFSSPLAYMVLTAFLFMQGVIFYVIMYHLGRPGNISLTPLGAFFGGTFFFWLFLLFVVPVITMRLISEELRSGTIEVLLTSPVTEGQVIAGKFIAAFLFYCVLWLSTVVYVVIVRQHSSIDLLPVLCGYLGVLLLGFMFIGIGTFASTLTKNQLIAAILTFALLIVLFSVPLFEGVMSPGAVKSALAHMNLMSQMSDDFAQGILDTRHVIYQLSVGLLFLFLATKSLEAKKGR
jgi:ABC-2 type transport system permease protein